MGTLAVRTLQVGQLETNCYIVLDEESGQAIIIDPGEDGELIINKLRDLEAVPTKIVATHTHFDHIGAVNELVGAFSIPFIIHEKDKGMLGWFRKSAIKYTMIDPGPAPVASSFVSGGDYIKIGDHKLKVMETPGHTPGGISLYDEQSGIVFVGDCIFAGGGVGRTDFDYCNKDDLDGSIEKLLKLPKETKVYSGHGESTTIGEFVNWFT